MKIAIAASGDNKESLIDPRFGRCPFFALVETETDQLEFVKNEATQAFRGAGISAAQLVVDKGAEAIVSGNLGPKAAQVLTQAGIKLFLGVTDLTIEQVMEKLKKGELKESDPDNFVGMGSGKQGDES